MLKDKYHLALKVTDQMQTGTELPILNFEFSRTQIFMYSAVTWNRHRIHYDSKAAQEEGHPDVLVQRGLIGNIFSRYANEVFVDNFITNISWKVISSVLPEQTLQCKGVITKITNTSSKEEVELDLTLHHHETLVCTATLKARAEQVADTARPLAWNSRVASS
ncbi:hypothetical protein [Reinekea sp.]|jgi:hydroxyacyl-ACP dehydratase HTD2-like protein with hotdog domain|uniref:hypothetical protein n=1 Tax=Reinekea sp. TaxID=1970455 RepID=UPI003989E70B